MESVILQLIFVALLTTKIHCRTINPLDNSIQERQESLFDKRDWVKIPRPPPVRVTQSLGSTIELICEVMGSPVPTVQWIQGSMADTLDEVESIESNSLSNPNPNAIVKVRSVLVIDRNLATDTTFTCLGRNGRNYQSASTLVHPEHETNSISNLLFHKSHEPQKPKIIFSYLQYIDLIGSSVILPCKAIGHPRAEIFWLDGDGEEITDRKGYVILPNGDLLISDLKWDDMGLFTCIARNSVGKDTINTFIYPAAKE